MIKIQIAYKYTGEEKELTFEIIECADMLTGLMKFYKYHPTVVIYFVLRCGKA